MPARRSVRGGDDTTAGDEEDLTMTLCETPMKLTVMVGPVPNEVTYTRYSLKIKPDAFKAAAVW